MSQKRHQEEGKAQSEGTSNPEDKRRRTTFQNVVSETMKSHTVQDSEEQIRKVVREEVELALRKHVGEEVKLALRTHVGEEVKLALRKHVREEVELAPRNVREEVELALRKAFNNMKQNCEKETQPSESRILELQFRNRLSLPLFTGARIKGEESPSIQVALVDCVTEQIVKSGPESSAKVEIVVLEGDFDGEEGDNWTPEEFKNNIVREREGKKPLLTRETVLNLYEGVGSVRGISFTDNSSWTRSRRFRLGARVVDNFDGTRVREAKTESFTVKEKRGELYQKHHPPALHDEVWRLEKIGKDGAFHTRLTRENISTVKDFLTLLFVNPLRLQHILGTGMPTKMWEVTVEHAQTCVLDKRIFLYCSPGSQQRTGVVFNVVGQVMYLLSECEYIPLSKLSETQKVDAQNLVLSAFEQWGEVVSFDDEASLLGGGSSTVLQTSSSPRGEDFAGNKFMATQKIGGFDYTQPPASSPDIISSIYSVGGTSALDDYALHNIDGMGLRYDQTLTFPAQVANSLICDPDSIAHAFCDDDHLQFFDTDLQAQNILPESPADLQSAVDGFLLTQRSTAAVAAIGKAQRRWTKLFSVLKWFSIRMEPGVRDIPRY